MLRQLFTQKQKVYQLATSSSMSPMGVISIHRIMRFFMRLDLYQFYLWLSNTKQSLQVAQKLLAQRVEPCL